MPPRGIYSDVTLPYLNSVAAYRISLSQGRWYRSQFKQHGQHKIWNVHKLSFLLVPLPNRRVAASPLKFAPMLSNKERHILLHRSRFNIKLLNRYMMRLLRLKPSQSKTSGCTFDVWKCIVLRWSRRFWYIYNNAECRGPPVLRQVYTRITECSCHSMRCCGNHLF